MKVTHILYKPKRSTNLASTLICTFSCWVTCIRFLLLLNHYRRLTGLTHTDVHSHTSRGQETQNGGVDGVCIPLSLQETLCLLQLLEAACGPRHVAPSFIVRAGTVASSRFFLSALCSHPLLCPPPAFLLWGPCGHAVSSQTALHLQCKVWPALWDSTPVAFGRQDVDVFGSHYAASQTPFKLFSSWKTHK